MAGYIIFRALVIFFVLFTLTNKCDTATCTTGTALQPFTLVEPPPLNVKVTKTNHKLSVYCTEKDHVQAAIGYRSYWQVSNINGIIRCPRKSYNQEQYSNLI